MSLENEKDFDCLQYKWEQQAKIYEEIKDMTPQEEIEYFRKDAETGPFAELVRKLKQQKHSDAA